MTDRRGELSFGDQVARVTSAVLDLYHLYSQRPGWDLEVELASGPYSRLSITGTGARPALPGPSPLVVAYLDHPAEVVIDGVRGRLEPAESTLTLVETGQGRVRITGTLHTTWRARDAEPRPYAIGFDIDAALVT